MNEDEKNKDIDVVSGDGTEIKISPVYDHIILDKPEKKDKKDKIVIPKEIKSNSNNANNNNDENK